MADKTKLVGRETELAALEREWRRSAAGELRLVLLAGDPGVGKTRLAEEMLTRGATGATTLAARARPLGAAASFGLWAEALEEHLRELPMEEVAQLCGGLLDDLASLLRSVAVVRGAVSDREPPRIRFLESLGTLLANLARRRPVLLFLDDMHLADPSSWEVLQYLALHFRRTPVFVVATIRPGELGDVPLAVRVLLDLEQQDVLRRIELGPLDDAAIQALAEDILGRVVGKDVLDWVSERSRGNALFSVGLLRALRDEGGTPRPGLRVLPEELTERVQARVLLLDEETQSVLGLLAVLRGRVELGELVGYSGREADEIAPALRQLIRTRLVVEHERGPVVAYEVAHPVIAETIYADLGAGIRFALHRKVGRQLLINGRLGEAALHFAQSAHRGDSEAIEVLRDALRQAEERGAYREALKILHALVGILPSGDPRWLGVAEAFHPGEWVMDHRADADTRSAVIALREIDALMGEAGGPGAPDTVVPPARRAMVKGRLTSFLAWGIGETEEAEVTASEAVELYRAAGMATEARLADIEVAYARGLGGDLPALELGARRVLAEAEAVRDERAALVALGVLGTVTFYQGKFAEAEGALRRSVAMAREAGKLYRVTWGFMSLGWSLGFEGRFDEALTAFADAKSVPAWRDSNVLELESHVRWLAGDFAGSMACAREAVELNPGGLSPRRAMGLCCSALSGTESDQLADARRDAATARSVYGDRRWFFASDFSHHAAGVLAWRDGRLPEALGALRTAASGLMATRAVAFAGPVLLDLAEVAVEAGDVGVAEEASARLDDVAAITGRDFQRALSALGRAWVAIGHGQGPTGEAAAKEAADLLPRTVYGPLRGRVLIGQARALELVGGAGGVDVLSEAAAIFEGTGAVWRRDRAIAALRSYGSEGRRAAGAVLGVSGLTPREREVARLAAERLTAQEIADRLFISVRTVEGHLARVYGKLGVSSKAELVSRLEELSASDR